MKGKNKNNIKKKEILRGKENFRRLFLKGHSVTRPCIRVKFAANGRDYNRIAVCIGKKSGKSNFRNYIKRSVKEIYRINKARIRKGFDLAILPSGRGFKEMSFSKKERTLISCLQELPRTKTARNRIHSAVCYRFHP